MISVYRMFQIIFGIIVSVFILYFLIQYAANYAGFQEDVQRVTILKNLKTTAESVHMYGNPVEFPDISLYDFSSCQMWFEKPEPPSIQCDFGEVGPFPVPALFSSGDGVVVDRVELDFGWYVMRWTEVMPESVIVFNPVFNPSNPVESENVKNLMKDLTRALPSTENLDVKVTFDFCDGNEFVYPCGGRACERLGFLDVLEYASSPASKCTRNLPGKYRLITISGQCGFGFSSQGVCVRPSQDGIGLAYLAGSSREFVYKDPLDIIALVVGGSGKDAFGKTFGGRLYDYKNRLLGDRLSLAAEIMNKRMLLVSGKTETPACIPVYSSLASTLDFIRERAGDDYSSQALMRNLAERLDGAKSLYQDLVEMGCEYYA
jgi:hypothetical protein